MKKTVWKVSPYRDEILRKCRSLAQNTDLSRGQVVTAFKFMNMALGRLLKDNDHLAYETVMNLFKEFRSRNYGALILTGYRW